MFKYIANAGRVTPCLVNDPYLLSPVVQTFYEGRMSFPMVLPGNLSIFDTSEEAYEKVKSRAFAGKVEDADLYMRDKYKITYMKLVEILGDKLKVRTYFPTIGYGHSHVISADEVQLDFEKVIQDFLRDSMLDVWEFNACNKQELLNQYKHLTPVELANLRLQNVFMHQITFDSIK